MVTRCTLFNISTVKTVFSLSMMVTTQTAKTCVKFAINDRLKIINVAVIALLKINRSNFYLLLLYSPNLHTMLQQWPGRPGFQKSRPPTELSKVMFESCKSHDNFLREGVEVRVFLDEPLCRPLLSCNCLFYRRLLGASPSVPHAVPLDPDEVLSSPDPLTRTPLDLQTRLLRCYYPYYTQRVTGSR